MPKMLRADRQPATASSPRSTRAAARRPGALKGYGIEGDAWSSDEEMFGLDPRDAHADHHLALLQRRQGDRRDPVRTDDGRRGRRQAGAAGAVERGVVPFLKVDKGLEDEADGVKLMKPMPELDALLRARGQGQGHVRDQDALGDRPRQPDRDRRDRRASSSRSPTQMLDHGLMPIIEPEVSIKSPSAPSADAHPARRAARRRSTRCPRAGR